MKMKKIAALAIAFCLAAVTIVPGMQTGVAYAGEQQEASLEGDYAKDEILVVFEDDVNKKEAQEVVDQQDGKELTVLNTPQEEVTGLVELPKKQDVEEAVAEYQKDPDVAYAQPNYKYKLAESSANTASTTASLNDSYRGSLWHLNTIQAKEAWDLLKKKFQQKSRVAVLDTGVDLNHPDLQVNLLKNLCKDTSNGTRKQLTGDDDGHGTHVTGIIGATANNGKGVAGVASGEENEFIDMFVVDIFRGDAAYTSAIIEGIEYAVEQDANVINISAGYTSPYASLEDVLLENAINNAVNQGTTVVCAAGNDNNTVPNYPADFNASISVISTASNNKKAGSSNYGSAKDISAPGERISSTHPLNIYPREYATASGTSMASPVVAGIAALLYCGDPDITVSEVKNILYNSATDTYTYGKDIYSGYGVANAYKAIAMQQNYAVVRVNISKSSLQLNRGSSASLSASAVPSGAKNKAIVWSSSNPSVVSVSADGKVTAKNYGRAVITAKSSDIFGVSASCQVTVPYTIVYRLNKGKNNAANPSSYYGKLTLKNPTRRNYTFAGWYKDSRYRSRVRTLTSGNYTLYAKWKKVKVSRASIKSLKRRSARKAKVYYKKVSGAKGYQIAYSTSRKFKKKQTKYKTTTSRSKTLTRLKKNRTYYVKVRAYKKDSTGKKVYGKYSKVKKVRLKR